MKTTNLVDDAAFNRAVATAANRLKQDFPATLKDEIGRLMANIIEVRTPPKTKSQGLAVVRGHILNVVTPVNERMLNVLERMYGSAPASGNYKTKRGQTIRFAHAGIVRDFDALKRYHNAHRSRTTGRTRFKKGRGFDTPTKIFVPVALFERYVKYQQKGVGMAKGGWWRAARHVYTKRPPASWITNKQGQGRAEIDLSPGNKPKFIAYNNSPWKNRYNEATEAVKTAMRFRAGAIAKATELSLKRAAKAGGLATRGSDILNPNQVT